MIDTPGWFSSWNACGVEGKWDLLPPLIGTNNLPRQNYFRMVSSNN